MINNRYIYNHAIKYLGRIEKSSHFDLTIQDWEDIKQEILIHIFQKKHLLDNNGKYKGYINTIIRNKLYNILRDKFKLLKTKQISDKNKLNKHYFANILKPKRLITKILEENTFGDAVTEYVQDHPNEIQNDSMEYAVDILDEKYKKIIELYLELLDWGKVGEMINLSKYHIYREKDKILKQIRKNYDVVY